MKLQSLLEKVVFFQQRTSRLVGGNDPQTDGAGVVILEVLEAVASRGDHFVGEGLAGGALADAEAVGVAGGEGLSTEGLGDGGGGVVGG